MMIQWGYVKQSRSTVSFRYPFTTSYTVVGTCTFGEPTQNGWGYILKNKTNTSFSFLCPGDMYPYNWIAIGK